MRGIAPPTTPKPETRDTAHCRTALTAPAGATGCPLHNSHPAGCFFRILWALKMFDFVGRNFDSGVRFSESATSISSKMNIGCHLFMEIRSEFFLNGIWDSGGFRRVRSGVRIRKLLTRASGTLLASRLRRDKILDFERQM